MRQGVKDWLFVAVGNKHLRLWSSTKDSSAVAAQIRTAWEMPALVMLEGGKSVCATIQLPAELSDFIDRFDRGLRPDCEREVDSPEIHQLSELARAMPISIEPWIIRANLPCNDERKPQATNR